MEQLKMQLKILKENKLKPNYAQLAREYNCDYRTVKKYNEGYVGKSNTRIKKSIYDEYKELIKNKLSFSIKDESKIKEITKENLSIYDQLLEAK